METTLGDFVKYLVLLLQKSEIALPFNNQELFHKLFYRLKKENDIAGKPIFLKKLWFDWNNSYPKSPELSEFLHALCWIGIVEANCPGCDTYWLSKNMEELWQEKFEKLDETTKQYLNLAVSVAKEEFERAAKSHIK